MGRKVAKLNIVTLQSIIGDSDLYKGAILVIEHNHICNGFCEGGVDIIGYNSGNKFLQKWTDEIYNELDDSEFILKEIFEILRWEIIIENRKVRDLVEFLFINSFDLQVKKKVYYMSDYQNIGRKYFPEYFPD